MKEIFRILKPGVPKRHLLLVAAGVWAFAGGFLMFRGIRSLESPSYLLLKSLAAVAGGWVFFRLLFLRISAKHIRRIRAKDILKPCIFSFFDLRSYLMMGLMITMGVTVRKLHLVNPEIISFFFVTMAIPLLLSSVRFFLAWQRYDSLIAQ